MGTASGNSKPGVAAAVATEAMEPIATRVVVKCIFEKGVAQIERATKLVYNWTKDLSFIWRFCCGKGAPRITREGKLTYSVNETGECFPIRKGWNRDGLFWEIEQLVLLDKCGFRQGKTSESLPGYPATAAEASETEHRRNSANWKQGTVGRNHLQAYPAAG